MYRKEALENRRLRWKGRAILLPQIPLWMITCGCVFFIGIFLLVVMEGTYIRRVTVSGQVTSMPRAMDIRSPAQGFIVERFVSVGQRIAQGDPIYRLDVSKSTRSGVVSENQQKNIQRQLESIDKMLAGLEASKEATLDSLVRQRAQYAKALKSSAEITTTAQRGVALMRRNMERYQGYHARGLVTNDQLSQQMALYYQQQSNQLGLSSQNEQNALQVSNIDSQLLTQAAEFDNRIYQMQLQRYELQKELVSAGASTEVVVRALSSGTVDSLSVTVGQMVGAGDSLSQIIPERIESYYLVMWVPNDSASYVHPKDKINVRYQAFPAEKFGQFSATIVSVSRTPATLQEMETYQAATLGAQGGRAPYYKVIARPDLQSIGHAGNVMRLENGMTAQATLFLEKRKVYQWMFTPFYDMSHSVSAPVNET